MKTETRLYLARGISVFGDWFTLLAVALFLNQKFGSDKVAYAFFAASLPSVLLSGMAGRLIPVAHRRVAYITGVFLQATVVLALTQASALWHYYAYLLTAGTLSAILRPLADSLNGVVVSPADRARVFTRLGGIGSMVLSIAPVVGGAVAKSFGFQILFLLDAFSFLLALVILWPLTSAFSLTSGAVQASKVVKLNLPAALKTELRSWHWLLIVGAVINAIEFKVFAQYGYSEVEIGAALCAWGVGSLIALTLPAKRLLSLSTSVVVANYGLALAVFVLSAHRELAYLCFVLGGFGSTYLGGNFRAAIQNAIPNEMDKTALWGLANRHLGVINLTFYSLCGALLGVLPLEVFAVSLVLPALWLSFRKRKPLESQVESTLLTASK